MNGDGKDQTAGGHACGIHALQFAAGAVALGEGGEVVVEGLFPAPLRAQDGFHRLAGGAPAAGGLGDEMRLLEDLRHGIGGGDGEAGDAHRLPVIEVIAHVGHVLQGELLVGGEGTEGGGLIAHTLEDIADVQIRPRRCTTEEARPVMSAT